MKKKKNKKTGVSASASLGERNSLLRPLGLGQVTRCTSGRPLLSCPPRRSSFNSPDQSPADPRGLSQARGTGWIGRVWCAAGSAPSALWLVVGAAAAGRVRRRGGAAGARGRAGGRAAARRPQPEPEPEPRRPRSTSTGAVG